MTDTITCPRCGSSQITANARGFSAGQALAGDVLLGPIGLLAGAAGNSKVVVTCLHCGLAWAAGGHERKARAMERTREARGCLGRLVKIIAIIILVPLVAALVIALAGAFFHALA